MPPIEISRRIIHINNFIQTIFIIYGPIYSTYMVFLFLYSILFWQTKQTTAFVFIESIEHFYSFWPQYSSLSVSSDLCLISNN